ncbi:hypothetical protein SUGI_0919450 [Cryptomeria japonica]|nr:hypothetical protein SUGI_0919450 [Cryptomeria japonica]
MVSVGTTMAGSARLTILYPRAPEIGIHRLNPTPPMCRLREISLILTLFWLPELIMVISKNGMGASGKEILRQIKQGFEDLTTIQLIRPLDRIRKDDQTFREQALSLSQRSRFHNPVSKTPRPTIFLDENKINSSQSNLLESCLFIKWGGGKQSKDNFESWHRAQWGNDININILSNDFYMIEFMNNKEKWQAKNRGPYILDGIEVHIIDWQPNFNPQTYVLPDSKVWIRLYNRPSDYWHIDVIKDICKNLGTFVSTDDILEDKLWGSFLKICISTNQVNKIPDEVRIIGAGKIWIQKIDREDHLHICPKCFSLDHSGISYDISAMIQQNYSCMQSPIEVKLQPEPPITDDSEDALCNDTLEKENVTLTEATPLIIVPPSFGQSESQQDLLTLLEKTKSLQADIESKIADSLPPSPLVPRIQLETEDGNPPS